MILNGSTVIDAADAQAIESSSFIPGDQRLRAVENDRTHFRVAGSERTGSPTKDDDGPSTIVAEVHRQLAASSTYEAEVQLTSKRSGGTESPERAARAVASSIGSSEA